MVTGDLLYQIWDRTNLGQDQDCEEERDKEWKKTYGNFCPEPPLKKFFLTLHPYA